MFEILRRVRLHNGFLPLVAFRLKHQLFAGGWTPALDRERIERGQAVAVLPYDPVNDRVVLVEQFRVGAMNDSRGPWLLEIAAGLLEPDEASCRACHEGAPHEQKPFDYAAVRGLSNEARDKLSEHRPATVGQAGRIPGSTPAAVSLLLVHLKKHGGGYRRSA